MNSDGSDARRVIQYFGDSSAGLPAWSPDGTRIAFSERGLVHLANADGSGDQAIPSQVLGGGRSTWSPDGQHLAYEGTVDGHNVDVFIFDLVARAERRLTTHPAIDEDAAWSPDGSRIAFTSSRSGTSQVWIVDVDGSNPRQLTGGASNFWPAWSPDAQQIAFTSQRDGHNEIYAMDADGRNQRRVTNSSGSSSDAAWRP